MKIGYSTKGGRSIFHGSRVWRARESESSDEYRMECDSPQIFGHGYDLDLFADWFLFSLECPRPIPPAFPRASILKTDTREIGAAYLHGYWWLVADSRLVPRVRSIRHVYLDDVITLEIRSIENKERDKEEKDSWTMERNLVEPIRSIPPKEASIPRSISSRRNT